MFATVFRVRNRGIRLPRFAPGVSGHLTVAPWSDPSGKPSLHARLVAHTDSKVNLLPELYHASVLRVTENGIQLAGLESIARRSSRKSSVDHYQQSWWCLVHTTYIAENLDDLIDPTFGFAHG